MIKDEIEDIKQAIGKDKLFIEVSFVEKDILKEYSYIIDRNIPIEDNIKVFKRIITKLKI